jgi:tetratricopeptide (TPR) repeat protein
MRAVLVVVGGLAVGVAAMLGILQPWKRTPQAASAPEPAEVDRREEALRLIRLAEEALGRRELITAQQRLAEAEALAPDLFEIPLLQGHLEMAFNDWSAARRWYTEALKRRPGDPGALAGRAAARYELKESAGAIEDATGAIAAEPDALFTRAAAYSALGQFQESIQDWTAYLARRPKDAEAWRNRGNAHKRLGKQAAAATDWKEAVKLDPGMSGELTPLINTAQ